MNLDSLTHTSGEWLRGTGPESDIVISSRIRLARNLAAFLFTNRASAHQKAEIEILLRERIAKLELEPRLAYINVPGLTTLDRQFLVERQLISRELATTEGPRGVALGPEETMSLMVNEEDHLRLQVMRSGFALDEAWQAIDRLDDLLEQKVNYAFSDEFGYLTTCPTNVGTGMRASVMLHLPALVLAKQIEKVFRALQKINLAVRGLYGEGSRASGDFYQISNQVTLGKNDHPHAAGAFAKTHGHAARRRGTQFGTRPLSSQPPPRDRSGPELNAACGQRGAGRMGWFRRFRDEPRWGWAFWAVLAVVWTILLVLPMPAEGNWPLRITHSLKFYVGKSFHVGAYMLLTVFLLDGSCRRHRMGTTARLQPHRHDPGRDPGPHRYCPGLGLQLEMVEQRRLMELDRQDRQAFFVCIHCVRTRAGTISVTGHAHHSSD